MYSNEVATKEEQSKRINDYVIENNYYKNSPLHCNGNGLYSRETHNKEYIDNETLLIRGEISQGIVPSNTNPTKPNINKEHDANTDINIGISTRVRRPFNVLSGITIDRFEPLNTEQIEHVTRDQPRLLHFGVDTRNQSKYS